MICEFEKAVHSPDQASPNKQKSAGKMPIDPAANRQDWQNKLVYRLAHEFSQTCVNRREDRFDYFLKFTMGKNFSLTRMQFDQFLNQFEFKFRDQMEIDWLYGELDPSSLKNEVYIEFFWRLVFQTEQEAIIYKCWHDLEPEFINLFKLLENQKMQSLSALFNNEIFTDGHTFYTK